MTLMMPTKITLLKKQKIEKLDLKNEHVSVIHI